MSNKLKKFKILIKRKYLSNRNLFWFFVLNFLYCFIAWFIMLFLLMTLPNGEKFEEISIFSRVSLCAFLVAHFIGEILLIKKNIPKNKTKTKTIFFCLANFLIYFFPLIAPFL